jgi:outer membrane translocation and assembly module TamA
MRASFGDLSMVGLDQVDVPTVRRTLAFTSGDLYRESLVLESQRRLVALGMLDFAHVAPTVAEQPDPGAEADAQPANGAPVPADAIVPMTVTVVEGDPTNLTLGLGYGTEDGPRGSL